MSDDRDRIARDLHDLVIQRLFATGMMLESAQRGSVAPGVRDGVGRAVDELDVTIQEIRTATFALQDDPGEVPFELSTRVEREIHMASVALGFKPSLRVAGPVDTAVGEPTGKNLVAALREGLSNAFRHAGASRIDVVVDANVILPDGRPGVRLTVDPAAARTAVVRRWCGRRRTEAVANPVAEPFVATGPPGVRLEQAVGPVSGTRSLTWAHVAVIRCSFRFCCARSRSWSPGPRTPRAKAPTLDRTPPPTRASAPR